MRQKCQRWLLFAGAALWVGLWLSTVAALAQEIPQSVQEELRRRGMTLEEARREAERLGIDLSDPEQAVQRARELGIPESHIQAMLEAVQQEETQQLPRILTPGVYPVSFQDTLALADTLRPLIDTLRLQRDTLQQRPEAPTDRLPYFGYDVFENIPDAFKPSPFGPVDDQYLVGPGDELRLIVWGATEFAYDLTVDREGRIFVPNVGQFTVAGKRLEVLRDELKRWLARSYAGLLEDPPTVFMDLTVTRLQPVYIYALGEVKQPGGYVIASQSTVFQALYAVGGPKISGSLRDVRVVRNGRVLARVDLYDYLLRGEGRDDVRLQNNDQLFVPPRGKTVAIRGAVRRPAIYELKEKEGLRELIQFAAGLKPEAFTQYARIERIIPFDQRQDPSIVREVITVPLNGVLDGSRQVPLYDGDHVEVLSVLDVSRNGVYISGAVVHPGLYEITNQVRTIRDLITRAGGVTSDVYEGRVQLVRFKQNPAERPPSVFRSDLSQEVITHTADTLALIEMMRTLDLARVLLGDPEHNLMLQPGDRIRVYSELELNAPRTVEITGKVRNPGTYAWRDSMTVYDLLFLGGGLFDKEFRKEVYLERADLIRRVEHGTKEIIIPFNLAEALRNEGAGQALLQPGDRIRIYPVDVQEIREKFVTISGAVKNPGRYRLQENMTLEDLILQAGGFTEDALLDWAEVTRLPKGADPEQFDLLAVQIQVPMAEDLDDVEAVSFALDDTTRALRGARTFRLQHRDRVYIRSNPAFRPQQTVTVWGEVWYPGTYTILHENETLADVLERAGGVRPTGYLKGARLIRGGLPVVIDMERAIRRDPRHNVILLPGDEIRVPPKPGTVVVRGNVRRPGLVKYVPGRRVGYYIERAGGLDEDSKVILVTQADGGTYPVYLGLKGWFQRDPVVDEGAIIEVVRKPPEEKRQVTFDIGKTLTDIASIAASTLTIIALARRL
ncbi:SLBB domain-containing protein [Rhodothermus profundi]|uniref:Protein involved in polysaccharide export, contains SLBB domain of the beta-grasp fold n=1 Tax=Rhodothermus profundi TaxID=633813 RepID=A0A1M6PKW3_9BACT|nr:SLBB domain-containing protein [Rhodothermus profundi]SHK08580.1 protein involved in polysaccharide export, contains SLBB domain of the beta-grasp fold [Rhodothermus profundi]